MVKNMMNNYDVSVDVIMSKTLHVVAESEEDARKIVHAKFSNNPYDVAYDFDAYVGHEITSVDIDNTVETFKFL